MGATGLATLEYAILHLDIHLLVVMGHEGAAGPSPPRCCRKKTFWPSRLPCKP